MVLSNGACKFLDEKTNLCRIYSTRPIFCNVDAYYEKYLRNVMTREEFYRQNKAACQKLRSSEICSEDLLPTKKIFSRDELPEDIQQKLTGSVNVEKCTTCGKRN